MFFSAAQNYIDLSDFWLFFKPRRVGRVEVEKLYKLYRILKTARISDMIFTMARSESMNRSREIRKRLFIMMEDRARNSIRS